MPTVYDVIVNYKLNTSSHAKGARNVLTADQRVAKEQARIQKSQTRERAAAYRAQWREQDRLSAQVMRQQSRQQAAIAKTAKAAQKASQKTRSASGGKGAGFMLADAFRWVGLAYLAGNTIGGIKSALIDFNTTLESTRISMATGLFGFGKVNSFTEGLKQGKQLVEGYRKTAAAGVGELKDYTTMHGALQGSVFAAGGNINQVTDMTKGGVVASAALGVEGWKAAQDIAQMVRGNVTERDYTAKQIIEMRFQDMGIATGGDALGKFREMFSKDSKERLKFIQQALSSKTLKQAQAAYETSMQGRTDQFVDNVKLALARVGEGLFEGVKGTLTDINKWITDNPTKIRDIAKQIGDFMVSLFNGVKTLVAFLYRVSGPLISAAKIWLAYAIATKARAAMSTVGGGVMSMAARGGSAATMGGVMSLGPAAAMLGWEIGRSIGKSKTKSGNTVDEHVNSLYTLWQTGSTKQAKAYLDNARAISRATIAINAAADRVDNKEGIEGGDFIRDAIKNEVAIGLKQKEDLRRVGDIKAESGATLFSAWQHAKANAQLSPSPERQAKLESLQSALKKYVDDDVMREVYQQRAGIVTRFAKQSVNEDGTRNYSEMEKLAAMLQEKAPSATPDQIKMAAEAAMNSDVVLQATKRAAEINSEYGIRANTDANKVDISLTAAQLFADSLKILLQDPTLRGDGTGAGAGGKPLARPSMNVTINRIQVESNDPERFVYGMREAFSDAVRNPSQAKPFIKKMGGGR